MWYWSKKKKAEVTRGKILSLCLEPGQFIRVASGYLGVPHVTIYVQNGRPVFEYIIFSDPHIRYTFHLEKDGWNQCVTTKEDEELRDDWNKLKLNAKEAHVVWGLVKHYARFFPFIPAENYFVNNGGIIA